MYSNAYLELSAPEQWLIKGHGHLHRVFLSELNVCKALGVTIVLVAKDGDSVNSSTPMEVLLKFLCCGPIVHLSNPIPVTPRGPISHIQAWSGSSNTMTVFNYYITQPFFQSRCYEDQERNEHPIKLHIMGFTSCSEMTWWLVMC